MPPAGRESLFAALFALLETVAPFAFTTRLWQSWDDTPPAEKPAMFMTKGPEDSTPKLPLPALRRYTARLVMYFSAGGPQGRSTPPSTQINNALDALDAALALQAGEAPSPVARFAPPTLGAATTLGGLCYGVAIDGAVETLEGIADGGDAMCIVNLVVFTTA